MKGYFWRWLALCLLIQVSLALNYTEVFQLQEFPRHHDSFQGPASVTKVADYGGVKCSQIASCDFYSDVLLVVKLNPVRLLWLDQLLNFYGTGFPHIVFWSALRPGEKKVKWMRVGSRNVKVHLVDDNYGFCDHYTVAQSMILFPSFKGYLFLSDDVFFAFWKTLDWSKEVIWKQKPSTNPGAKVTDSEKKAVKEVQAMFPQLRNTVDPNKPLFAPTSGVYFVPRSATQKFIRLSAIFLLHRTYNEFGTPTILHYVDEGSTMYLRGKLVWGIKRVLSRRMISRPFIWYHPVRASGELFARLQHFVRGQQLTQTSSLGGDSMFSNLCMDCATWPVKLRRTKGLYHSCVADVTDTSCEQKELGSTAVAEWPQFREAAQIGGKVFVSPQRRNVTSPLELEHEGFWNQEITDFVFDKYLPRMNRTSHNGILVSAFPECCRLP